MRMTNYGKTFRIQSDNPVEAKALFEAGLHENCPRSSGIMMDNGRGIDFAITERREACLVAEYLFKRFGDQDAWAFDTLVRAAIRGEREAYA